MFAIDINNVIFIEGYDNKTSIKSYNLENGALKQIGFKLNVPMEYDIKIITLNTIMYDNQYKIQLYYDAPYLYLNNEIL